MFHEILDLYFKQHDSRQIIYHQIASFNYFLEYDIPEAIMRCCPIRVVGSPDLTLTGTTRAAAGTAGTAIRVTVEGNDEVVVPSDSVTKIEKTPREVEVIVQLNERLAGGTKFFIGHSATVQGPSYSTSYELLSPNNQVVASSDSPLIQATAPLAVSRVKLVAIPAPIADTADPSILRSITITRVD